MISLQTKIFEKELKYDGTQLSPHWIYETFQLMGNALVSFQGPADVSLDHMVDLEDVRKKAPIYSPKMLHFIGEWFIDSLDMGILLQHLFIGEIYETLWEMGTKELKRQRNDIYYQGRKLSVSICTRSPVSVLMHTGLNIETKGTPIPTSGLAELKIEPQTFTGEILERFLADSRTWDLARVKVRPR